jgi:hypothetical protein
MKKGDIVVCIANEYSELLSHNNITVGKQYVIDSIYAVGFTGDHDTIRVSDDVGTYRTFSKTYFKTLQEHRENKLNELGV